MPLSSLAWWQRGVLLKFYGQPFWLWIRGQLEAAQAIGLTNRQAYIRIVFPQALRSALPNLCNLVINLVKGTSLVFVMTIKDITAIAKVEASYGYQYFESYLVIFILYIVICGVIQWGFNLLEKRLTLA